MKIFVNAKASARTAKIEKIMGGNFRVCVKEPAHEGKANEAIRRALAEHFGVPASRVKMISGYTSRKKVFGIS